MPAYFKTGRERTLVFGGDLAGDHSSLWECVTDPPGSIPPASTHLTAYQKPAWSWGALGVDFSAFGGEGGSISIDCTVASGNYSSNLDVAITGISSFTVGDVMTDSDHHVDGMFSRPGSFSRNLTGSWEVTLPVEEIAVIDLVLESDVNGFPQQPIPDGSNIVFFGDPNYDGIVGYRVEVVERAKLGSTLHGEAALGGAAVSVDCLIVADNQFSLVKTFGFGIDYGFRTVTRETTLNDTGTASITGEFMGTLLTAPYNVSTSVAEVDATAGVVASVLAGSSTTARYSEATIAEFPLNSISIDGRARTFAEDYPTSIDYRWIYKANTSADLVSRKFSVSASGADAYDQLRYGCAADLNGSGASTLFADEWTPTRAWVDDDSLTANGEDTRDWRLQAQVWPWEVFNVGQDNPKKVADGTTVDDVTTDITLLETVLEGYRYLQFTQNYDGATTKNLTLTIGLKEYRFQATDAGSTITIDLCAPSNLPSGFKRDERDSRFPLDTTDYQPTGEAPDVATGIARNDGWIFGVLEHPAVVSITGIDSGESCAIGDLNLIRVSTDAEISVLLPFQHEVRGWTSPSDDTFLDLDVHLVSDGKEVGPWPCRAHIVPFSSAESWNWFSLAQLQDFITYAPGWTCTTNSSPSEPYVDGSPSTPLLTDSLEAGHLDGFVWNGTDWVNQVAIVPTTLFMAFKADSIYGYPGCGDPTVAYGALTDPLPFRTSKLLRAQSVGMVFDPSGAVLVGKDVELEQFLTDRGTEPTDSLGVYRTLDPYGFGYQATSHTFVVSKPTNYESFVSANRYRHRTSFRIVQVGPVWIMQDEFGRLSRGTVEDGDVWFRRSASSVPLPDWEIEVQATDVGDCIRCSFAVDLTTQRLLMLVERDGPEVHECYSDDDGSTWSDLVFVVAGTFPYIGTGVQDGSLFRIWQEADFTVSGQFRGPGDTSWSAPFTLIDDTSTSIVVADGGMCNPVQAEDSQMRWSWSPILDGDTDPTDFYSTDDGRTWKAS